MIDERYELVTERISEINSELEIKGRFNNYFKEVFSFAQMIVDFCDEHEASEPLCNTRLVEWNKRLYDVIRCSYSSNYLNPSYAVSQLGEGYGQLLSAIFAECTGMIAYAYEKDKKNVLIRLELILEIYSEFILGAADGEEPSESALKSILSSFAYDYLDDYLDERVVTHFTVSDNIADKIVREADLTDVNYLYHYGEYISENEIELSRFIAGLDDELVDRIARTYTEGYRMGFETTGKDISIKETVNVEYFIGFERIVRRSIELFELMGLKTILYRAESSFVAGRKLNKRGYYSTNPNKQFDSDHENDYLLYFDRRYVERKLEAYRNALERHKLEVGYYGGPAVIDSFGELPFCPEVMPGVLKPDEKSSGLMTEYMARAGELLNQYIKGEERSFTIIAFPIPAIGDRFREIFRETVEINTLDYVKYRDIQQKIIDTLDKGSFVRIQGCNGNETDMTVALYKLSDPAKETIFENCVADVNIPVGEVFTSPVLEGTTGLLHAKHVYLEGLPYEELKLRFNDGVIESYSCNNYDENDKNAEYIKEHLLFHHKTLPLGEFAIGTNTRAYMVTRKYSLESIMPILIAEKTGPHFAVGDTCYSHEEDIVTYNPDGKAIVARQNSISAKRHDKPLEAYFNCHTDITIPYDELGRLYVVTLEGQEIDIIRDGRFVLEGTSELNEPFDE